MGDGAKVAGLYVPPRWKRYIPSPQIDIQEGKNKHESPKSASPMMGRSPWDFTDPVSWAALI